MYRQGDVLIRKVDAVPANATASKVNGSIILAESEATGHAHAIRQPCRKVKHFKANGVQYLEVRQPVTVEHEEHGPIALEPGAYEVRRQVEVWMDEIRQVAD